MSNSQADTLDSQAAALIQVYMESLSQYHKIFLHRTLATWRNLTVDTAHRLMKRAFQTWSWFLRAHFREEKAKSDDKYAAELREMAIEALQKPCHQRSSLDINRICAWFKNSKIFGKKKIPPKSMLIIAKEAAIWNGPANRPIFFQGMRGDGSGPCQKDAWWQFGYYMLVSGKVNMYSFSDKAQEAHALSRFVLAAAAAPRSPAASVSSKRGEMGTPNNNWSQDDEDRDGMGSDVLSQSASGRSLGSAASQQERDAAQMRSFDPPKTEVGVPEMSQFVSPHQKARKIYNVLSPKPKLETKEEGDEEREESVEDFPNIPPPPVLPSPLTFEPSSPSFVASSYATLFSRKEQSRRQPGSAVATPTLLEEPGSPPSATLRRSGSRGADILDASPASGGMRRKSSTRILRGPPGLGVNTQGSFKEGKSPVEPPSGGSLGTPNAFKRQGSFGSGLLSPTAEPNSGKLGRRTSFVRGKTPERQQNSGSLTAMGSSQSLTTAGSSRRLQREGHSASANTLVKEGGTPGNREPSSAAMSSTSPPNTAPGTAPAKEPEKYEFEQVDFLNPGVLGDLIFSTSNFGHTFGEIALVDKQNPVRTTAAVLAEPSLLLVIGPDAFARSMSSEVVGVLDMRKKLEFLERPRGLFSRWRNAQLSQLSYVMQLKTFLPRDVIHEQGNSMSMLMFVKQGNVRAVMTLKGMSNSSGKEQKFKVEVGCLGEGSIIDDVGLVDGGGKYTATFIADTVVEVLCIKVSDFDKMITNGIGQAKTTYKDIKSIAESRREMRFNKVMEAKQNFADANNMKEKVSSKSNGSSSSGSASSKVTGGMGGRHSFRSPAYDMAWANAVSKMNPASGKKSISKDNAKEGDVINASPGSGDNKSVLKFTKVKGVIQSDHLPTTSAYSLLQVINDPLPPI